MKGGDGELEFEDAFMDEFEDEDKVMRDDAEDGAVVGVLDGDSLKPLPSGGAPTEPGSSAAAGGGGASVSMDGGEAGEVERVPSKDVLKAARQQIQRMEDEEAAAEGGYDESSQVFRPGVDKVGDGEELDYQPEAYKMYHSMQPEWPCLSIDVMPDMLGAARTAFPHTVYLVAGTQADRHDKN